MLSYASLGPLKQVTKFVRVISNFDHDGQKCHNRCPFINTRKKGHVPELDPDFEIFVKLA